MTWWRRCGWPSLAEICAWHNVADGPVTPVVPHRTDQVAVKPPTSSSDQFVGGLDHVSSVAGRSDS